ncbi:MAG TPA: glycosyltransferase family 1 protein [Chloroflexia bacterium]|nr:glycosyltransferase family 1 protein [Chloroflexia bacterium]
MRIVLAGIIGRYPYGGVGWCSLMYLLGLRALGHEVWYLEDTGECNLDPVANTLCRDPRYALDFIHATLAPHGFGERWCYIDWRGRYHGQSREVWQRTCSDADLFLNLSGGSWFWRDEYAAIPHTAFIDSDPVFTQRAIARSSAEGSPGLVDFFTRFATLFTFGRNIGTPACAVPVGDLQWVPTWQPVALDAWAPTGEVPQHPFTTVMTWNVRKLRGYGGNKNREFGKVLRLPSLVDVPLEVAVNGPREFLHAQGWQTRTAFEVSHDLDVYRDYLRSSRGEFSVAKQAYVQEHSGWFSDRTACYLASGRPAVVQDTGFSAHLPTGEGLFAFGSVDEAIAGLEAIVADYPRHTAAAHAVARAHFAAEVVLPRLLERATSGAALAQPSAALGGGVSA